MASSASESGSASGPTLGEVIENLGFGCAQFRVWLVGGSIWFACGAELIIIGSVGNAIAQEWGLTGAHKAWLMSCVFIGILTGNAVCGPVGDLCGRRMPILFGYLGIALFSVLSAFTTSYEALCAVRVLVGVSFGIGQPAINTLCTEVTPAYWRIAMNSAAQGLFIVGEMYSAFLIWHDDPYLVKTDWRWLTIMGTLPAIVFGVLGYFFLRQSPSFLAGQGETEAARGVLESMRADNGVPHVSVDFREIVHSTSRQERSPSLALRVMEPVELIFSRRLLYSTLTVLYSCFTLNCIFYGVIYAVPQVVTKVDMGVSPAISILQGALCELPGVAMAIICGMMLPRKPVMIVYLAVVGISLLAFAAGAKATCCALPGQGVSLLEEFMLHGGLFGIKCFAQVGFVVVYQYSTEIYPVMARTTGSAACVAGGRVGGMTAPMIFEFLQSLTGSFDMFFHLIAMLCLLNFVLVIFLPFETFGKDLQDSIDEDTPLVAPQGRGALPVSEAKVKA
mmetsp:Transcript_19568/g.58671  ORF Transcript_19568/g.58671 Transcript_19568/m.58671 type:complete len:506 (+) Transcript_19568:97-1614(+)